MNKLEKKSLDVEELKINIIKKEFPEVLVDGKSKTDKTKWSGRTTTNKIVIFDSGRDLTGEVINVKINRVQSWTLFGEIV